MAAEACPRCGSNRKSFGGGGCDRTVGFHQWHSVASDLPPTGTHVSGPTNSTRFTNCCGAAVNKRYGKFESCPVCNREVE